MCIALVIDNVASSFQPAAETSLESLVQTTTYSLSFIQEFHICSSIRDVIREETNVRLLKHYTLRLNLMKCSGRMSEQHYVSLSGLSH